MHIHNLCGAMIHGGPSRVSSPTEPWRNHRAEVAISSQLHLLKQQCLVPPRGGQSEGKDERGEVERGRMGGGGGGGEGS